MVLKMSLKSILFFAFVSTSWCAPQVFETRHFKIGIEYDKSLPMSGGSDRYRHMNNYDPFFVTITAMSKKGYVISYLEVSATVDEGGDVHFSLIRGDTGSSKLVFQLVSNRSDFLKYSYLAYGIREEEYNKISMQNNLGEIMASLNKTIYQTPYTYRSTKDLVLK